MMLIGDEVSFLHTPQAIDEDGMRGFLEQLRTMDIWITAAWELVDALELKSQFPKLNMLRWPLIRFPAFHPDITLANSDNHQVSALGCVYNSAICLWAWQHGVERERAIRLFSRETFSAIGYLAAIIRQTASAPC